MICYADGCEKESTRKGLCGTHYQRMYLYGRLEKIKGIIKGICTVDDCKELIKGHGYCSAHYQLWKKNGKAEKLKREKRSHPFYSLWFERKQSDLLVEEWLDFTNFVKGISPKPEGNYLLLRLNEGKFGPNNFRWQEHLKRKEDETKKEWHARKWAARQHANPSMERERHYQRKYGISIAQYEEKLKEQNFVCAICGQFETSISVNSGTVKKLAVDHNHKTGKTRELLCWRCNGTIGKIDEDLGLLKKIENYLIKHKEL